MFVANPNKPKPILEILLRNQDKLVEFLTRFHTERSEDEQFNDEKAYLIKQIKELKPITDGTSSSQQWFIEEFWEANARVSNRSYYFQLIILVSCKTNILKQKY